MHPLNHSIHGHVRDTVAILAAGENQFRINARKVFQQYDGSILQRDVVPAFAPQRHIKPVLKLLPLLPITLLQLYA